MDCTTADRYDPAWHLQLAIAGRIAAEQTRLRSAETWMLARAMLLSNPNLTEDSYNTQAQHFAGDCDDYAHALQPWEPRRTPNDVLDVYRQLVGDPEDPAFQRRMAAATLEYRRRRAQYLKELRGTPGADLPEWYRRQLAAL